MEPVRDTNPGVVLLALFLGASIGWGSFYWSYSRRPETVVLMKEPKGCSVTCVVVCP